MLELGGICVPITLRCNLRCKYCFRTKDVSCEHYFAEVPDFTSDMILYIKNLSPSQCKIATVTGGEPFLCFDKVKFFFSLIHKDIHKKIISNGTLLTQEIVDYINENDMELQLSFDGPLTKKLRGVNVLEDETLCGLIRQVKKLTVSSVITKYNVDVWENFFYVVNKLGRTNIHYGSGLLADNDFNRDLVEGFDYDTWFTTWMQFQCSPFRRIFKKKPMTRPLGLDCLPDGTVCGNLTICSKYGTIHNMMDEIRQNLINSGDMDYCIRTKCSFLESCQFPPQCASPHLCKCRKMIMENSYPAYFEMVRNYLDEHLSNIKEKYDFFERG